MSVLTFVESNESPKSISNKYYPPSAEIWAIVILLPAGVTVNDWLDNCSFIN